MPRFIAIVPAVVVLAALALPASIAHSKEKQKAKEKEIEGEQIDYLVIELHESSAYRNGKKQPAKHKGQTKPGNTLSR